MICAGWLRTTRSTSFEGLLVFAKSLVGLFKWPRSSADARGTSLHWTGFFEVHLDDCAINCLVKAREQHDIAVADASGHQQPLVIR
jgi:hypothetical protein